MTAPERIWAAPPTDDPEWKSGSGEWDVSENWAASRITEYVRADLAAIHPSQVLDMIRREDALECFMGLDRIGDIKDAIAALEPQADPRDEVIARLGDALRNLLGIAEDEGIVGDKTTLEAARAALAAAKAVQ